MKDFEQEQQKLRERQERERGELDKKYAIHTAVLNIIKEAPILAPSPSIIHTHGSYGTNGSAHFEKLSKSQVIRVLQAFENIPKINYIKSYDCFKSLSVINDLYADTDIKKNTRICDGVEIEPTHENLGNYKMTIDRTGGVHFSRDYTSFKLRFLVNLEGVGLIEIVLESEDTAELFAYNIEMSGLRGRGNTVKNDSLDIKNGRLCSWDRVRYAAATSEYCRTYLLIAPYEYDINEILEVFGVE